MRWLLVIPIAALAACDNNKLGDDLGRPSLSRPGRPSLRPLVISQVFAGTGSFVQVQGTAHNVSLAGLSIRNDSGSVELSGTLENPGDYAPFDTASLNLQAAAGEVAVVGPAPWGDSTMPEAVHAYLAWGADPGVFATDFAALALWGGVWDGEYVPLPFPMSPNVAVAVVAGEAGCATPNRDAGATQVTCPADSQVLAITEVKAAAGGDSWVEILNTTSADNISLYGVRLCQMPACVTFGRTTTLAASTRLVVHLGAGCSGDSATCTAVLGCAWKNPACTEAEGHVYFPSAEPVRASGELALLAPGPAALDQGIDALAAYQSFVRYGAATGMLSDAAVAAARWSQSLDAASAPRLAGESLSVDASCSAGGSAWNPTAPTPLAEETDICTLQGSDCVCGAVNWTSCSFPAPARRAAASPLVIRKLTRGSPSTLEIFNTTNAAIPLSTYLLTLGDSQYTLTDTLEAGATLVVALNAADMGIDGEASLFENAVIRQHVQWGIPPGPHGADAEAAGVWPDLSTGVCALAALDTPSCPSTCTTTLTCTSWSYELVEGDGQSPVDYELACDCACQ